MAFYISTLVEGKAIIYAVVGSSPEELETAFGGVQLIDLAANRKQLTRELR